MVRTRRCFLLADTELPDSLSSRKLMLESVKFNVLSAYSGEEALAQFERFPRVDAVVIHARAAGDIPFCEVSARIKSQSPKMFIVVLAPTGDAGCEHADAVMSSHDPKGLVEFLVQHFGAEDEMRKID
ncbi:MAG: hypothetical protein NVS9B15_15210 [Acidobacteriaceae bacterium]